jgi:hypothetical protein
VGREIWTDTNSKITLRRNTVLWHVTTKFQRLPHALRSKNSMALSGRLDVETGSEKVKMAAAWPDIHVSVSMQDSREIPMANPCFRGRDWRYYKREWIWPAIGHLRRVAAIICHFCVRFLKVKQRKRELYEKCESRNTCRRFSWCMWDSALLSYRKWLYTMPSLAGKLWSKC